MNSSNSSLPFDPSLLPTLESRLKKELDRREEVKRLESSLIEFVRAAWSSIDSTEYQESWAIDALCEHLEAVTRGQIRKLLINFPPRCGKSNVASVCWPAWVWAQSKRSFRSGPQVRFLCGSYNHTLSLQHSNASRRLLCSPFFQERWGDTFAFQADQNAKNRYDNDEKGSRIATSVGGSLIGIGGDVILVDDPHNTEEVESDAERDTVLNWWKELSTTRMNDPKKSAIVVIMQRLHQQDVSGIVLEKGDSDWEHLMLPMRYDDTRHCRTSIGWEDPRSKPRELMWPERFGEKEVKFLERELGPYLASGRLQQSPTPSGGGIIHRDWWQLWDPPDGKFPRLDYILASADTAYTEKEENDPTGFVIFGTFKDRDGFPKVVLLTAWRKRLHIHGKDTERRPAETDAEWVKRTQARWGLCEWLAYSCRRFKVDRLIIEGKASGLSVAQELRRLHAQEGWGIMTVSPEGDKVARAYAVQSLFSDGLVFAPDREWAEMVIEEASNFPKGKYDDLTDATTQALKHLREIGLAVRREERTAEEEDRSRHRSSLEPIYHV